MFPMGSPDRVEVLHEWRTHHIKPGESLYCCTVGPPVCPLVHWSSNRSRPCLKALTNGELRCPCEDVPSPVRRVAYLPVLTSESERVVVMLSNKVAHKYGNQPHGTRLKIARTRTPCAPLAVFVNHEQTLSDAVRKRAAALPPQDIRPYLLNLWRIDALTRWCDEREAKGLKLANEMDGTSAARDTKTQAPPAPVDGATTAEAWKRARQKR